MTEAAHAIATTMWQEAPYPFELASLVKNVKYKPKFTAVLTAPDYDRGQGSHGLTLIINATVPNSLNPRTTISVNHLFIVPAASYNKASWMRWLFDRFVDVEVHEACEFFKVKGERVFAPHHSEGEDPYTIWMIGDAATAAKKFTDT